MANNTKPQDTNNAVSVKDAMAGLRGKSVGTGVIVRIIGPVVDVRFD